jgi:hypothetical protein
MSADSLAVALMALEDPTIRDQIKRSDFTGLHPDVQLSSKEERLLVAAAAEDLDPEVAGFDASSSAFFNAASGVPGNIISGPVANNFQSFMSNKFSKFGGALMGPCACPPMQSVGFAGFGE